MLAPHSNGRHRVGRGEGVVDDKGDVVGLGDGGHFFEGKDGDIRVAQGLAVDELGVGPDRGLERLRIRGVDEGDVDADARQGVVELVIRAAVETAAGDDMVPCPAQRKEGHGLRAVTAAGRQRPDAAFEVGDALFQHVRRRIHDAGVDVAKLLQGKEIGRVFGIPELETRGLVDGRSPATGRGIRSLACMELSCRKAQRSFFAHCTSSCVSCCVDGVRTEMCAQEKKPLTRMEVRGGEGVGFYFSSSARFHGTE